MKLNVTRQAVCAADDQLNDLEMSIDISNETTLAHCVASINDAKFLQFSSTHSEAIGYLAGRAVVRCVAGRSPEYLIDPNFIVTGHGDVPTLSFLLAHHPIRPL